MSHMRIEVNHIARVEGHGHLIIDTLNGKLEECRLDIVESPRFFEAMLVGRKWDEIHTITSRICGICSIGHTLTSLKATESAFGITVSEQTILLRKLLLHAETLQSHILHAYFLAAPDFFGAGSVIPLAESHPEVVLRALRLKKLANEICDSIGGRTTHPITCILGGFSKIPSKENLCDLRQKIYLAIPDILETATLFSNLDWPDFRRTTESIALEKLHEYTFYDGKITSSLGKNYSVSDYLKITNERVVEHSTAKHTRHLAESYRVGALARYTINSRRLLPEAKFAAENLKLDENIDNPYYNSAAQIVECLQAVYDSIEIIDTLLEREMELETIEIKPRAGKGVGAIEVPRGILFHDYTYNDEGKIVKANCVIPTGQNLANIESDLKELVPKIIGKTKPEITLECEMLVRAYDPCISCATHLLEIEWK